MVWATSLKKRKSASCAMSTHEILRGKKPL